MRPPRLKTTATTIVAGLLAGFAAAAAGSDCPLVSDNARFLSETQYAEARDTLAAANKNNVNFRLSIVPETAAGLVSEDCPGNTIAVILALDGRLTVNFGRKFRHAGRAHVREIVARRVEDYFLAPANDGKTAEALLTTLRKLEESAPKMGENSNTFTLLVGAVALLAAAMMLRERRGGASRRLALICLVGFAGILAYVVYERYVPLNGMETLEYSFRPVNR